MKTDKYGAAINDEETYTWIAACLERGRPALIAWTDQEMTQFDLLFVWEPSALAANCRLIQGGCRSSDLFVSIMRMGAFGFEIEQDDTHPNYYAEKLHLPSGCKTVIKLAELINGVKRAIKNKE